MMILPHGFSLQGDYTAWNECIGYWLLQGDGYVELHILRRRRGNKEVQIQTGDTDTHVLRSVLSDFIPEMTDRRERVLDMIIRLLKI